MGVSFAHARHQGANLAALARIARLAAGATPTTDPVLPGPERTGVLPPRPSKLVADAVRWAGGDARAWRGQVPPWLFPQWGLPLLARTLEGIPYPVSKVLNQGCQLTVNGPLPTDQPLHTTAQLLSMERSERKVRLHQQLRTGPADQPDAVVADVYAVVPLPRPKDAPRGPKRDPALVPADWRELGTLEASANAGWEFALLTGDFNPIHWLTPAARMAGFRSVILHGFGTMAKAAECVTRHRLSGDVHALRRVDVRFVKPLVLPARARIFIGHEAFEDAHGLAVGSAAGGPAVMLGRYSLGD